MTQGYNMQMYAKSFRLHISQVFSILELVNRQPRKQLGIKNRWNFCGITPPPKEMSATCFTEGALSRQATCAVPLRTSMHRRIGRLPPPSPAGPAHPHRHRLRDYESTGPHRRPSPTVFQIELAAGFKTIQRLTYEGRLLLIFDGFDEMERRAADYRHRRRKLLESPNSSHPAPRSSSPAALRSSATAPKNPKSSKQGPAASPSFKGDDVIDLADRREFEIAHLTRIRPHPNQQACKKLKPDAWEPLWQRIQALPKIQDSPNRSRPPRMLAQTLSKITRAEDLNLATLYEHYTD